MSRQSDKKADKPLAKRLQQALKALEKDLLERAKLPSVEAGLRVAWEAEKKAGETGQGFDPWRRARVTQIAVAWVLSVVFVRTLEDRGLIDPRIAGPNADRLAHARDREATFVQVTPFLGPREYLLAVFRELSHLPGAREIFDARHNPVWVLAPSSAGARALVDFFQQVDAATGAPVFTFPGTDTRFLGDLYQNLSEAIRKRYALLQTPEFVEKFILEQTLHPAIDAFGLSEVKLIDPTCGSGHFLLGAFRELLTAWQKREPGTPIEELSARALAQIFGVDINPYAVAIARFRLVLAVLEAVGIKRLGKAPVLRPKVDAWTRDQLVPLLAGVAERVPWLLQWHNDFNDAFGMKVGEFFRDFVAGEAHGLGVAVDFTKATDDLRTWTPPAAPKRKTLDPEELYAAFSRWTPEVDEDAEDDGDSEPPEGPTAEDLASEVVATKALVNKALKKLLADGRIEKLDGRPARYLATGDDA